MELAFKNRSSSKQKDSYWLLLKSVSRSFYLSLRYLPDPIRLPLSLAYLLARLTDTIADCSEIPVILRKDIIIQLQILINEPEQPLFLNQLMLNIKSNPVGFSAPDLSLIEHIPFLFELLKNQPSKNLTYIQDVMDKIIQGQLIDLHYFDSKKEIVHFSTDAELENYLYLVAGCVGEFWTKLCCNYLPNYSKSDLDDLLPIAINFGKALQLTNILRDIPKDLANGRFYLPLKNNASEDLNQFIDGLDQEESKQLIDAWHNKALHYLEDAARYIETIKNRRVRFACLVPFLIAKETLNSLKNQQYIKNQESIKISRKQVYKHIRKALYYSISDKWNYYDLT